MTACLGSSIPNLYQHSGRTDRRGDSSPGATLSEQPRHRFPHAPRAELAPRQLHQVPADHAAPARFEREGRTIPEDRHERVLGNHIISGSCAESVTRQVAALLQRAAPPLLPQRQGPTDVFSEKIDERPFSDPVAELYDPAKERMRDPNCQVGLQLPQLAGPAHVGSPPPELPTAARERRTLIGRHRQRDLLRHPSPRHALPTTSSLTGIHSVFLQAREALHVTGGPSSARGPE